MLCSSRELLPLQRSRRPKTAERFLTYEVKSLDLPRFNEAAVRRRRRAATITLATVADIVVSGGGRTDRGRAG